MLGYHFIKNLGIKVAEKGFPRPAKKQFQS